MEANRFDPERTLFSQKYGTKVLVSGADAEIPLFPITIRTQAGPGKIHGTQATRDKAESYWRILSSEWNVYPPELMPKTQMKHIILCENLGYEDLLVGRQERTALPDFGLTSKEDFQLFLDVGKGRDNEPYVRAVIHHEFFHIMDWCDDHNLDKDEAWTALNPLDFEYGKGGETELNNPFTSVLSEDKPGFLNQYSTSALREDKAEVFAYMMMARDYMEKRAMRDDIIRKKMQLMEKRLQAFCPQLHGQFWERARAVARPPVQPGIV
jgi:hypothetical protein